MKMQFKLGAIIDRLPAQMKDEVFNAIKSEGLEDVDDVDVLRTVHAQKAATFEEGERAETTYISTRHSDRIGDVMVPKGWLLKEFKLAPQFLWGHNYDLPPLGSDETIEVDEMGLKVKSIYADTGEGTMADVVWKLVQQGHLKTSSVGFAVIASTRPGHTDWEKTVNALGRSWPEFAKSQEGVTRVITKALLLEHSKVSVAMNPNALTLDVARKCGADDDDLKYLGFKKSSGTYEFKGQVETIDKPVVKKKLEIDVVGHEDVELITTPSVEVVGVKSLAQDVEVIATKAAAEIFECRVLGKV